jgi:hypothetical protein
MFEYRRKEKEKKDRKSAGLNLQHLKDTRLPSFS